MNVAVLSQVEHNLAVGVAAAALDVEHLQGVLFPVEQLIPLGIPRLGTARHFNGPVCKVDLTVNWLVDTADVHHKLAINKHPHVVIAVEFKNDVIPIFIHRCHFAAGERKVDFHVQAEMVIQSLVPVHKPVMLGIPLMEREKAYGFSVVKTALRSNFTLRPLRICSAIYLKHFCRRIEPGIVPAAVIIVIILIVLLEQTVYTHICADIIVIITIGEQVCEIFIATRQNRIPCCPS